MHPFDDGDLDRASALCPLQLMTASDLDWEEATGFGATIGALVGWGAGGEEGASYGAMLGPGELADGHAFDEHDRLALLDLVPPGASAALVLVEHTWARPLRDAVARANERELDNRWLRADDLVAHGLSRALPRYLERNDRDEDEP